MEKIVVSPEVRTALDAFRGKSVEGRAFLVLSYEGKNGLKVEAHGVGFVDEAVAHLPDGECRYVYLRTEHQVEAAKTTKYAFVDFTPDSIPPMRKALLSTHKGQVSDLLKPAHVSLQIAKTSEVSEDLIMDMIAAASGTKVHETKKAAFSAPAVDISRSAAAKEADYLPSSAKSSRALALKDEDDVKQAFKDVRADSCETDWALLGFTDGDKFDTLELKAKGQGGVAALLAALDPSRPNYGLFRTREQIDKTSAVRFSFLRVVPTSLPPSKKAQIGTMNGAIESLFKPYAFDFDKSDVSDISVDDVNDKISALSGMKNMSLTSNAAAGAAANAKGSSYHSASSSSSSSGSGSGAAPSVSGKIALDDALAAALKAIRSDSKVDGEQLQWLVASKVAGSDALVLRASGYSFSVDDCKSHFESDNCNFALLRVVDQIDQSSTIKFVFVRSQPEATPAMKKSAVSTKLGLYQTVFSPFSTELFVARPDELTTEAVMDKVASASGSKSKVVDKK